MWSLLGSALWEGAKAAASSPAVRLSLARAILDVVKKHKAAEAAAKQEPSK